MRDSKSCSAFSCLRVRLLPPPDDATPLKRGSQRQLACDVVLLYYCHGSIHTPQACVVNCNGAHRRDDMGNKYRRPNDTDQPTSRSSNLLSLVLSAVSRRSQLS
ncbi:unnamed protein product [Pleuronectes platessa]|uniref:Uncharacterized protein n=1 Tax=Pleuronectes platessa TaxID=8262 RepID=A0A9N7TH68_PLEPL|nr:unnamed protein product [Pleuronectes platessa]